jgi:uncharacterized protein
VTVTALCPGPPRSGFQSRAGMEESRLVRGREIMDAATVAQVASAGLMRGRPVVIPGRGNWLAPMMPRFPPRRIIPGIVKRAQGRAH